MYVIDLQGGRTSNAHLDHLSITLADKAVIMIEDVDTVGLPARQQEE